MERLARELGRIGEDPVTSRVPDLVIQAQMLRDWLDLATKDSDLNVRAARLKEWGVSVPGFEFGRSLPRRVVDAADFLVRECAKILPDL